MTRRVTEDATEDVTEDAELIGGPEGHTIIIVASDPGWPARFQREERRIRAALGATARRADRIGSTSVPGLAAKPIVDIQVSVPAIADGHG
jgi:GrpB-like predicted nucleotidyltransferase (UPF0157 family)